MKIHRRQAGLSLVSTLVAVALLGILVMGFSKMVKNNLKTSSKMQIDEDLEDLRQFVRLKSDCAATDAPFPSGCNSGTEVDAKQKNSGS